MFTKTTKSGDAEGALLKAHYPHATYSSTLPSSSVKQGVGLFSRTYTEDELNTGKKPLLASSSSGSGGGQFVGKIRQLKKSCAIL